MGEDALPLVDRRLIADPSAAAKSADRFVRVGCRAASTPDLACRVRLFGRPRRQRAVPLEQHPLAMIGRQALTVTTSCTINFMRKPALGDLIAEARILKLGRSLIVGDVMLYSDGMELPVAQASLTYSIPPVR